ncbi:MAG: glutathione-dependent reductase [Desulfuromonas sp.]|nr:MAG: glutathione-dependent reductase [Desulfuromonas sp.]
MLVNGKWTKDWQPVQDKDNAGRFLRQRSSIRNWVTPDGRSGPTGGDGFPAAADRYHLYVALICPWACRTLFVRKILGLEQTISVSIASPVMTPQGWKFGSYPGATVDHLHDSTYMHELYTRQDPVYTGRATVPVLWDKQRGCMVNNESADILRMLNSAFTDYSNNAIDFYPPDLRSEIDKLNHFYYEKLNNGVYRAGFATSQKAYEEAYDEVFSALDDLERRLQGNGGPFVFGRHLTETDVRLFVTLVRFDVAYHGIFKCNKKRIKDYPNISRYLNNIYQLTGVASTVSFDHIKTGYYSLKDLNPNGIIPKGPEPLPVV